MSTENTAEQFMELIPALHGFATQADSPEGCPPFQGNDEVFQRLGIQDRRRPMTPADLGSLLKRLKARPDGTYRGLASLMLPGKALGPFVYTGRRKDDPNDIIPHELRRELRGMRVIASWINHADVKDINAMDLFVQGDYVKHYMLDFGSTMESGDFIHGPYRVGHEYIYDGDATLHSLVSLGFYRRPWESRGRLSIPRSATIRHNSSIRRAGNRIIPILPFYGWTTRMHIGAPR